MIARIPFVPVWQIALSIFLLVISTLGMVYLAAKIYRVGILMYGKQSDRLLKSFGNGLEQS